VANRWVIAASLGLALIVAMTERRRSGLSACSVKTWWRQSGWVI